MPPPPAVSALSVRGLAKAFAGRWAVAGVDLDVPRGSFYGLLGPNGAGKTTMLRMACGLLRPDAGGTWIDGWSTWEHPVEVKARIGVVLDSDHLFERLTGPELLEYLGLIRGVDAPTVKQRSTELLAALGLANDLDTLIVDYSAGMRKKIGLASALLHAPSVLILDEPFEAVDPVSARTIRSMLEAVRRSGSTVIMSSHVMAQVELMCDHVGIIAQGQMVSVGTLDQVRGGGTLEEAFVRAVGADAAQVSLSWLPQ